MAGGEKKAPSEDGGRGGGTSYARAYCTRRVVLYLCELKVSGKEGA